MDLRPAPEDEAFRHDVREFVARELPDDIRRKVLGFLRVERDDYVRWQRILHARGWGAPGWPVEHGGCGWNAVRRTRAPSTHDVSAGGSAASTTRLGGGRTGASGARCAAAMCSIEPRPWEGPLSPGESWRCP